MTSRPADPQATSRGGFRNAAPSSRRNLRRARGRSRGLSSDVTPDGPDAAGIVEALTRAGVLRPGARARLTPLTGGVSSDVFRLDLEDGPVLAVKRSIPRLRVREEWLAPVSRADSEVAWLRLAREIAPRLAPEVLAEIPEARLFVMRFLEPATHPVWKEALAAGQVDPAFAGAVGRDLALIHGRTAGRADLAARFATDEAFFALRISPFLLHPRTLHPDVADRLTVLAADLAARKIALAHGDVSPKNILIGPEGPVFLDAETVVYGDPAFDFAFCYAHLLLKALWLKPWRGRLTEALAAYEGAYLADVTWESASDLAARAAPLVAALILARVDGKSPAPYLTDPADQAFARATAKTLLKAPDPSLAETSRLWREGLERAFP